MFFSLILKNESLYFFTLFEVIFQVSKWITSFKSCEATRIENQGNHDSPTQCFKSSFQLHVVWDMNSNKEWKYILWNESLVPPVAGKSS